MNSFLAGLMFGYGASVPIGPVNIVIMTYALRSFSYGFAVSLGAMTTDVFYLVLTSFGALVFLDNAIFSRILAIFGFLFLLYISYLTIKNADNLISPAVQSNEKGVINCFLKGLFLNLVNPYVIAFWLCVSGFAAQTQNAPASIFGLIVAIFTWITFLSILVSKSKRFIGRKMARILAYASAILMIFFAFMMIYNEFFKA